MALGKMRGKAWVFGDIMDVDWEICPFESLIKVLSSGRSPSYEELGQYCMTVVDPDFPKKVQKGDFIVAGENMGYGHDHDHACVSIRGAGVAAVICNSTNSNFFRNSYDHGLPVVEIPGIRELTREGDELELDMAAGKLKNLTKGEEYEFTPIPEGMLNLIEAGGLYPYLTAQVAAGKI